MGDLKITTTQGGSATISEDVFKEFKAGFRGPVLTADDRSYEEVRVIWNGMHDKRPAFIARCSGSADVIAAVNFSRTHQLLVAVRGGGHNVGGSASCDGGIMIDLSLMKGTHIDAKSKTVYVQGGATWGDLDRETQVYGYAVPGGVVSTTGVGGLTLGGGLGWLRRKHGLSIDSLLSMDIVTADGKIQRASEDENTDLFWGLRGGGGNFGIVTSFEFRLHPVGPMVTLCAPWYPVELADKLIPAWEQFMKTAPEELSSSVLFWTIPPVPGFPPEHHGKRAVILAAVHCGPVEEGERIIKPLRELATPMLDLSGPIPWTSLQSAFDPFFPKKTQLYYFKSRYLNNLNKETLDAIIPLASNPPSPMVLVALWHYGGAMTRVETGKTAFTGRDAPYLFSVDAIWEDPGETDKVLSYSRNFLASLEHFSTGGMYVNFAGLGEEGEALVKSAYGSNYEKLVALKNKYDPGNMFRLNQNIKPTV